MRKEVVFKINWKSIVSMATPYMILENGVGLQIQSYLGFYLFQNTKVGVKKKLRQTPFFLWSDM